MAVELLLLTPVRGGERGEGEPSRVIINVNNVYIIKETVLPDFTVTYQI